ncbi:hypothetical protein C7B65_06505 [Phormidesmis priestleyi ULC007]|uniref:Uncharacterized protein n=1 Tax=Phormidesmis priestleyi ULC007 TaxID=1920490 RepID=A0A2T1DJB4_9CYAN|nr:hypothetical protein [Phormidesmis priestleyi]PSB20552.1 hypothetical protein C7B65_06505 [Phormidesmis priestleyi ULC007]PZO54222.1 MAG: hypothetical protein DCF14_02150 [Phormidesmis priestleyi]
MPLPVDFSSWEHLQSTMMQVQNRIVREEFNDLGDESWDDDITQPRGSLRVASTLRDNDSAIETLNKLLFFYVVLRKAADLQAPIYGIPVTTFQDSVKFLPQVRLFFLEDSSQVEEGYSPVEAEITFRVMNETSESMTEAKAKVTANKIKTLFCAGNGFAWKKGRELWMYKEPAKGYNLQLYAWNETEAKKVIEQILDVQSDTPNWEKHLEGTTKKKTFRTIPASSRIYGKVRREARERPIATVRFRYAELKIHGLPNDVQLVDRTGFRHNPLVKAN